MSHAEINMLPGASTPRQGEYRRVRNSDQGAEYLERGRVISGSLSRDPLNTGYVHTLRAGLPMGMTTTGKKWRPSILGYSTADYVDNDLSITVSAATATEVARLITLAGTSVSLRFQGPATVATGAVVDTAITVTAASGTTLTVADLNIGKIAGALITPADGSQTILGLIDDGEGIKVTDQDGNSVDQPFPYVLVGGSIDTGQIINYPPAAFTTLVAQFKAQLNSASSAKFRFSDAFQ